jgi:hypothetical protein
MAARNLFPAYYALPFPVFSNVQVLSSEFMPVHTVSFSGVLSRITLAAHNVFAVSNRLHMCWINASRGSAQMIDHKPVRNRADKQFVSGSVSASCFAAKMSRPVTLAVASPQPNPTGIRLAPY